MTKDQLFAAGEAIAPLITWWSDRMEKENA
jgi:hypothetical protein